MALLFIEREFLKVHPAIELGFNSGGDDDSSIRRNGGEDVLFGGSQDAGGSFVGKKDVWDPEGLPERRLSHDGLLPVGCDLFEDQPRVDITELEQDMDLKLQIVSLQVLDEVDVGSGVNVHRQPLIVFIEICTTMKKCNFK